MAEWSDSVAVLFVDGPLAGEVHQAPARAGMPVMMLRVRLGEVEVEVRSAGDQQPGSGWVSYLGLGMMGRRSGPGEPWPYVYSD
ncbi:MAG: hypothetical protein QG622_2163 [Actinomycetota bacterium]|nr:hypothetical protein [Actinomycetota bacterium]